MLRLYLMFTATIYLVFSTKIPYCWNEHERVNLKFKNNPKRSIDHLPTIRLIQGFWGSQTALQYLTYLYLTEKMGITVSFYPSDDPNSLLNRYSNYTYWCNDTIIDRKNETRACSKWPPYPHFHYEYIKDDLYDLLFELWDTGLDEYFHDNSIDKGGLNYVYGDGGWFVPKYIFENHPKWLLPSELMHNETVQKIFIESYTNLSNKNYFTEWWNEWGDNLQNYPFEFPYNISKPIIWGASLFYVMSNHSQNVINEIFQNKWYFVAFGDELKLSSFIIDLYAKRLPFIANMYTPHIDFATIVNGKHMEFEHVLLPRNAENRMTAECFIDGKCQYPLQALLKIGNPKLREKFPEIYDFLLSFHIKTQEVNIILSYFNDAVEDNKKYSWNLSDHELWINTTCKWLKENEEFIQEHWYQEIIRYDCSDYNECGFNYYFTSVSDAMQQQNALKINNGKSIGGYCANSSTESKCICPEEFLGGNDCRTTCSGLIGPILNNDTNSFYFFKCNNNGVCDINHWLCVCDKGFAGEGCEIQYKQFHFSEESMLLFVIWMILLIAIIILCILLMIWLLNNDNYRMVKVLSTKMTSLFAIGMILSCIGTILHLIQPIDELSYSIICNLRVYCYGIGAILVVMCPLLKAVRVHTIFTRSISSDFSKKDKTLLYIPDKTLIKYLIYGMIIELFVCISWTCCHANYGENNHFIYSDEYYRIRYQCHTHYIANYLIDTNYVYIFFLMLLLIYFSFKNRKKSKVFPESNCAFLGSLSCLFLLIIVLTFYFVTQDIFYFINIQCMAIFIAILPILLFFYFPIMYRFYKLPKTRDDIVLVDFEDDGGIHENMNNDSINLSKNDPDDTIWETRTHSIELEQLKYIHKSERSLTNIDKKQ